MNKKIFSWLFSLGLMMLLQPLSYSQKVDAYDCHWQAGQSPQDGEEFINKMFFDEKSKMLFYLSNDEKDLYITLIVADPAAIQKIMRYGLTTWFNPEGKHKKELGIEFPLAGGMPAQQGAPQQRGAQQGQGKPGGGDRKDMMNGMLAGKNKELAMIGFNGKGERDTMNVADAPGIIARMEMIPEGKVQVSLIVPVSLIEAAPDADKQFSLGIETGYMDLNQTGMGQSAGSGQSSGDGHGGGMYGGPPPGSGGTQSGGATDKGQAGQGQQGQVSISELAKPNKLWISQVKLSAK